MKVTKLLNEKQRRIGKWRDKVSPVAEWLSEKQEVLTAIQTDSIDIDTARQRKNKVEVSLEF